MVTGGRKAKGRGENKRRDWGSFLCRLCYQKKYTHTPADTLVLGYREITMPMRVGCIYMDNDSVRNTRI